MLKHPFYKYSFITLLLVDICYYLVLVIGGSTGLGARDLLAALSWFVTFFWLPVWLAAWLIFALRKRGIQNTLAEWLIGLVVLSLGNTVTDITLALLFSNYPKMGGFVILNAALWTSIIYFASRYIESRGKMASERYARKQAQIETLRYQLNPHFMFNSLNTISAYIYTQPDRASQVLHELADILRYSLDTAEQQLISLQQELSIIQKYLRIEQIRFGDKLTLNLDIPNDINNISIPPLLLQPIIENSLKHSGAQQNLVIDLSIRSDAKGVKITVADNGKGFNQQVLTDGHSQGIGMKNLQQRVAQMENASLSISNNNGAVVCLELNQ